VHYHLIRQAVQAMPCPVIANGNVHSAAHAREVLATTGARGLMIGRGAIRSPWLFEQIRQELRGEPVTYPTGRDVLHYIRALWASQATPDKPEKVQCDRMKKFVNYLGEGVPAPFLHYIRRAETAADFDRICRESLDHDEPMRLEPYAGAGAAPTAEDREPATGVVA
jgi:tRNA-dihydrouridine synthase B